MWAVVYLISLGDYGALKTGEETRSLETKKRVVIIRRSDVFFVVVSGYFFLLLSRVLLLFAFVKHVQKLREK